ncbi:GAF domain-containing protein [Streptomyces sp. F001]|uniref:GAF domain-containing protein n=1 Tax=Streptomyces sp. F001 TaxID=1510026 RepID=UPI00320833EE
MRVTEGSVAARFQQLRLGMGEGLGGLVAQTARPYVTDDYFKDDRFQHTATIDAGVRDEGLVAILGVPLMLGHHVIGVLFAADRRAGSSSGRRSRCSAPSRRWPRPPSTPPTCSPRPARPSPAWSTPTRSSGTAAPSSNAPPTCTTASPSWCCAEAESTTWPPPSPRYSAGRSSSPTPPPHRRRPWRPSVRKDMRYGTRTTGSPRSPRAVNCSARSCCADSPGSTPSTCAPWSGPRW